MLPKLLIARTPGGVVEEFVLTKLLIARTPRAVVEEVILPEGLKFTLENWDEFEEREHHLSSEQLQSNVVSYIL